MTPILANRLDINGEVRRLGFAPIPGRRFNSKLCRDAGPTRRKPKSGSRCLPCALQGTLRIAAPLSNPGASRKHMRRELRSTRDTDLGPVWSVRTGGALIPELLNPPTASVGLRAFAANLGVIGECKGLFGVDPDSQGSQTPHPNPGAFRGERAAWEQSTQQSTGAYVVWLGSACANPRYAALRSEPVHATKPVSAPGRARKSFSLDIAERTRPHKLAAMRRGTLPDGSRASVTRAPGQRGHLESGAGGVRLGRVTEPNNRSGCAFRALTNSRLSMRGARAGHKPMRAGRGDNAPLMKGRNRAGRRTPDLYRRPALPLASGDALFMDGLAHGRLGSSPNLFGRPN